MSAYYNEIDPFAAQWLRNLIAAGHIAAGDVDERSIADVKSEELKGYTQCHFFAGIGVWSHALRLAGWDDSRPVWTGSCPCQPFSAAGRGNGSADSRHLWPAWFRLIRERQPVTVFGEQVASADGLAWLDLVHADLEAAGYAVGALDICAAGFGAPHIRQRLYFVADSEHAERWPEHEINGRAHGRDGLGRGGDAGELGHAGSSGSPEPSGERNEPARLAASSFWSDVEWLPCRDGKARPTQPGLQPLAHGAAARVGRLRAYGNCIVAPQAAEFIAAFMEYAP